MPDATKTCAAADCHMPPKTLEEIKASIVEAMGRVPQQVKTVGAWSANTVEPAGLDDLERCLLSSYSTRWQLEFAGYCSTCALRGQLRAIDTGRLRRPAHA